MHLVPLYLLDKEEIFDRAVTVKEFAADWSIYRKLQGVYFLIQDNEIVYIGSTKNLRPRLQGHRGKKEIKFNRLYAQRIADKSVYCAMEILYIGELKPKFNRQNY